MGNDIAKYIEEVGMMLEEKEAQKMLEEDNKKKKISLFEYMVIAAILITFGIIPLVLWLTGAI